MVQCSQGPSDPEEGRAAGQWRSCGDSLRRRGGLPDRRRAAQIGVQDQRPRRRGRGGDEEEADGVGGGAGRRRPQPDGGPCCRCRSPASCWACGRLRPPQPLHLTDGPTSSELNFFYTLQACSCSVYSPWNAVDPVYSLNKSTLLFFYSLLNVSYKI